MCVVTDPPALSGLKAMLSILSPISKLESHTSANAAIIIKAENEKSKRKSFSHIRARGCLGCLFSM